MNEIRAHRWDTQKVKHPFRWWIALRLLLLAPLLVIDCVGSPVPVVSATGRNDAALHVPGRIAQEETVGMDLSTALSNGKPTLILFTPVEMCRIRYCLQPSLVMERLVQAYPDQINFVVAHVYAFDSPDKPRFPVVDLGVYLVEPYATWVPEIVQTQFGWGIDAPSVVLVDQNGNVLVRSEFFDVGELRHHIYHLPKGVQRAAYSAYF